MPDDELLTNTDENTEDETEEENTVPTRSGGDDDNNEDEEENDVSTTPNPLGKLQRSNFLLFLETTFDVTTSGTLAWYKIGKHVSDLSVELNPSTETVKNILDESEIIDQGYEPSFDVDTYYATPTDGDIYNKLKDIMMNRKTGDACRTFLLEVIIDTDADAGTTGFEAWKEEVIVKPTSYGGPQGGVSIPYKVSCAGNRVKGTVTFNSGVPTFAAANS